MTVIPFIDLKTPHEALKQRFVAKLSDVIEGSHLILGGETLQFEQEFAAFCGASHAIGVGNGLDALKIILLAMGIGAGDEVIVPAHTFIATWLAVSDVGATPVAVDIDLATYTLDPTLVEQAITPRTRAIMPVHLYGRLADMAALGDIARRHGLKIIEDAAQAHGASNALGQRAGVLGNAAAFSFYPAKNLGALGDGGAIVTNDDTLAERCRLFRNYGSVEKYYHDVKGLNSRLDELQSAFLRLKLPDLEAKNTERERLAQRYMEALSPVKSIVLPQPVEGWQVWHLFVIRTAERDRFMQFLKDRGVATLIHYPLPPHLQQAYADAGYKAGDFPMAEQAAREVVSLPFWPEMSEDQQAGVIETIRHWDAA
jgi:dTDP-4-amino-4,6-dideoxygalactose transaminase